MAVVSFSVGEALGFGWKTFKEHAWLLLAAVVGLFGLTFAVQWGMEAMFGERSPFVFIANMVLSALMGTCFISFYLDLLETGTPDFEALFNRITPKKLLNMLAYILSYSFLCMVGFVLLIVPGIVFGTMFSQGGYLIVDRDMNFLQAMQASAKITKGAKVDLFLFGLAGLGLALLGLVALVVGVLVASSVFCIAQAYIYRELRTKLDDGEGLTAATP